MLQPTTTTTRHKTRPSLAKGPAHMAPLPLPLPLGLPAADFGDILGRAERHYLNDSLVAALVDRLDNCTTFF